MLRKDRLVRGEFYHISDPTFLRVEVTSTGTLLIDGANIKDTGTYTCFASNPYGQASASTKLTVLGPPAKPSAPWISSISRNGNNL